MKCQENKIISIFSRTPNELGMHFKAVLLNLVKCICIFIIVIIFALLFVVTYPNDENSNEHARSNKVKPPKFNRFYMTS